MENATEVPPQVGLGRSRIPIVLIALSAIMAIITFVYYIYADLQYNMGGLPSISNDIGFVINSIYSLFLPLFTLGIALLLFQSFRTSDKNVMGLRRFFLFGALAFLAGALVVIVEFWVTIYQDWSFEDIDFVMNLSLLAATLTISGEMLCLLSAFFLIRAYLRGDITINRAIG